MNLANYQIVTVRALSELFNSVCDRQTVKLTGDSGSGKTTIALGYAAQLPDDWCSFYITGIDASTDPFMTWHIGTKLFSKSNLSIEGDISFGIDTAPLPVSFGISLNRLQIDKKDFIFSASEEALLAHIKKKVGKKKKVLIIADDFIHWDMPSVRFLHKLSMPEINALSQREICIMLITDNNDKLPLDFSNKTLSVPTLSDDDILHILHQNRFSHLIDLKELKACAGNDLSLMLMAANYFHDYDRVDDVSFFSIMDKRYNNLSETNKQALKILEPLAILDEPFTHAEAAFFLDSEAERWDPLDRADECIHIATQQDILIGEDRYCFANGKLQNFFRSKLDRREKYNHRKFAEYLQCRYPEKYYRRGLHMKLGMTNRHDKNAYVASQLLLLSYLRRISEHEKEHDLHYIREEIENLMQSTNSIYKNNMEQIVDNMIEGVKAFSTYEYSTALIKLQTIPPALLIEACRAEQLRLILLCYVQLACNPIEIQQTAFELYDLINSPDFCEDEQYCRAALVLIDVFLDRSTANTAKSNNLKRKLIRIINEHLYSVVYLEINACLNRKAALYYPAPIAAQQAFESVCFYKEHFSIIPLYMALCNWCANSIVAAAYSDAQSAINEITNLMNSTDSYKFPSVYKVRNNVIILKYLIDECNATSPSSIHKYALAALNELNAITDFQGEEVSHVILLNKLGFMLMCDRGECFPALQHALYLLNDTDDYYRFYIYDLMVAYSIITASHEQAVDYLNKQAKLDIPLLYPYAPIFKARRHTQLHLIHTRESFDNAISYNQRITSECQHIQDSSCIFLGRGILMSDLQFLSI